MKYVYAYKTPDGVRHEASLEAPSREAAFEALRARGVRAIKVVAADGSKANGEAGGVSRRAALAAVCAFAALAAALAFSAARLGRGGGTASRPAPAHLRDAAPLPRQTIPGDRARIAAAAASLASTPDRLLATFAEPGRPPPAWNGPLPPEAAFADALRTPLKVAEDEFTESVDLKRIVTRIKADLRRYIAAGGTAKAYVAELFKRQRLEASYRAKAEARLEDMLRGGAAEAYDFFLRANAQLQSMGIYPLPLPDRLREHQLSVGIDE